MAQQQYVPEQEPEQGGIQGALSRQIGPLKAWQWGVIIGGAGLLYVIISNRSGGSQNSNLADATVPFTSVGDSAGSLPGTTTTTTVKEYVNKTLLYYRAKAKKKISIRDKTGKVVGYIAAGRTILLGKAVKINGKTYYPIINMPGKYVAGLSWFDITPIYGGTEKPPATTSSTSNAVSTQLSAPDLSSNRQASLKIEDIGKYTGQIVPHFAHPSPPTIDTQTQITSKAV